MEEEIFDFEDALDLPSKKVVETEVSPEILEIIEQTKNTVAQGQGLTREEELYLLQLLEERERRDKKQGHLRFFPEEGPLSYDKYEKHMEFFKATAKYNEVLFLAGNRVGKTIAGAYAVACWATGIYPSWWEGRTFAGPTNGWVGGDTGQTVRDIAQKELLGEPGALGTGMIPEDKILKVVPRPGIPNAVDHVLVEHVSGGTSYIGFKSYDQGRRSWQGTAKDWIHLDEEPPIDVYSEALVRIMTTKGILIATLTPLKGLTPFIMTYLEQAGMNDVIQGLAHKDE